MKVDQREFLDKGFIVLRGVVPPDQLDALRLSVEVLVDRHKAISEVERGVDGRLGGRWYAAAQPRVNIGEHVCAETANAVEFSLSETTFGVSRQLMQAPQAAVSMMQVLCRGIIEFGYTGRHR